MSKISGRIDYIDAMNACVGRTTSLLRAAAEAGSPRDRETFMFLALEEAEAGENIMREEAKRASKGVQND